MQSSQTSFPHTDVEATTEPSQKSMTGSPPASGEHPEAIDQWKQMNGINDNRAI